MRKMIIACLAVIGSSALAQKHEIKWNIGNTILHASAEIGYEYLIDNHQSIGSEFLINDVYNLRIGRQATDFDTHSFKIAYSYYTGDRNDAFQISPFIQVRTGDYQKYEDSPKVDMDSFIVGIGGGYKWNINDKFVFGPYFTVGRNFSEEVNDEFNTPVEIGVGFGIGYRF
ncbi:DUF3575 domain-containing protein [Flavobacterium selenitireducens]|uniref:DUF3575 domain-containing protein n=1 Tax=Flavobacterium selenitireducens TaxID=2722704 RepID=UPI00168A6ED5|nr:DUF3575 domain-containing protein [Flavobacterium selenitireducens]MBD3582042.1 porin family protein [Flavobacterium selenitireducens]